MSRVYVTLRSKTLSWVRTFRTPRKQRAETKSLPFGGMSLSSAGSLRDTVRISFSGGNARHACVGYGPGWRVGSGGESSKLVVPRRGGAWRGEMTGMDGRVADRGGYSLTKTQKVRVPIGWPLMPWRDHRKGVGRHPAMWRLSDRACGPRARRCSLADGKEIRCPASETRWPQGWTGYEIGGWRDGTSPTSPASLASPAELPSCLATSHLCTSPQFPSEFLRSIFLELFFFSFRFGSSRLTAL
jgi:hypothetical protein